MSAVVSTAQPLPEIEMKDLKASLQRGSMQPRDHLIKLKAVAQRNTITCAQLNEMIDVTRTIPVDVCILMYPALSDKDNFQNEVLDKLQWQDQRDEIKKKLSLE